jgi:hypothetical protein
VLPTLKKLQKLMRNQKNAKNMGWQHCICQGITRFLGIIGDNSDDNINRDHIKQLPQNSKKVGCKFEAILEGFII